MLNRIKNHFAEEWSKPEGKMDLLTIGALIFAFASIALTGLFIS